MSGSWILPDELQQLAECGDESLVKEVLGVFRTDTAERLAKLRAAIASNDRAQVKGQAHAMKGSAGQVGAHVVAALCVEMEREATVADVAALTALADKLDQAFAEVSRAMPD